MAMENLCIRPIGGRHVAAMMIGFFAVVIGMNAVFLTAALKTNTGVVAVEPYRKGLRYNERIEADARQHALGWSSDVKFEDGHLLADIRAHDGTGIGGLDVEATIGRPATMAENTTLKLTQQGAGIYAVNWSNHGNGAFIIDVTARDRGETAFRIRRRLWLQP